MGNFYAYKDKQPRVFKMPPSLKFNKGVIITVKKEEIFSCRNKPGNPKWTGWAHFVSQSKHGIGFNLSTCRFSPILITYCPSRPYNLYAPILSTKDND